MPNKLASIKDVRKSRKRTHSNLRVKTNLHSLQRSFLGLVREKKFDEAGVLAHKLQQALDKAAKIHVIHKNRAAKSISALQKAIPKTHI